MSVVQLLSHSERIHSHNNSSVILLVLYPSAMRMLIEAAVGRFWTLGTGMRRSLFLYTMRSCWMRIILLCFKLYLKSTGDRFLGSSPSPLPLQSFGVGGASLLSFLSAVLGGGCVGGPPPPQQYQWSEVFMTFLCVPVMKITVLLFFSPLSNLYYNVMSISASSVHGRLHSSRCVVFVFLAFILQFSMNIILYICISV